MLGAEEELRSIDIHAISEGIGQRFSAKNK